MSARAVKRKRGTSAEPPPKAVAHSSGTSEHTTVAAGSESECTEVEEEARYRKARGPWRPWQPVGRLRTLVVAGVSTLVGGELACTGKDHAEEEKDKGKGWRGDRAAPWW